MRYVLLDPDGTWPATWLGVLMQFPSGVTFRNQCGGVTNDERSLEGYFVPVAGLRTNPDDGPIDPAAFGAIFHNARGGCVWGAGGDGLPKERLVILERRVSELPFWLERGGSTADRVALQLDHARVADIAEAWVPVTTPEGLGVLVWANCG